MSTVTTDEHESTVRSGRKLPYKQLPDAVIDDNDLEPEAKLTYWYLKRIASYADDRARVSISRIAERMGYSKASKRSVRSWIESLESKGWIDVVHRKSDDGKTNLVSDYIVHDIPRSEGVGAGEHLGVTEHPGVGAGEHLGRGPGAPRVGAGEHPGSIRVSPRSSSPRTKPKTTTTPADAAATTGGPVEPDVQAGVTPTPEPSVPGDSRQASVETPDLSDDLGGLFAAPTGKTGKRTTAEVDALFEEFWAAYPRKTAKRAALLKWRTVVKTNDPHELINAVVRYAQSRKGEDPRFTAHASTWLNQERWNDEPTYARVGNLVPNRIRDFKSPEDQSVYDVAL